jgi:hypothetical protein
MNYKKLIITYFNNYFLMIKINNMPTIISEVYPFIVDQYTFERMQDMNNDINFSTYQEFLEYNIKCIDELSSEDQMWLLTLCKRLKSRMIHLVDTEHCAEFYADSFYFNQNKKLCIANPR